MVSQYFPKRYNDPQKKKERERYNDPCSPSLSVSLSLSPLFTEAFATTTQGFPHGLIKGTQTFNKPYSVTLAPWLHSHCPGPRWPCPKAGSLGFGQGLWQWLFFVSGHHSSGLLLLQQECQIARKKATSVMKSKNLMDPDSDPFITKVLSSFLLKHEFSHIHLSLKKKKTKTLS